MSSNSESIIRLVDVVKYYKELPHQKKAIDWLDASTGEVKQQVFARIYRNKGQESGDVDKQQEPDIKFSDAFRYFEGTAWQVNALNWLQVNTHPKALEEFAKQWRSTPPKITSDRSDYWQQMTHGGTRNPRTAAEKQNIERACDMLEILETHLGVSLVLTSGFRPEPLNSQVGGVPGSYHTRGLAADVYSPQMDDFELERKIIDFWYYGDRGGVGQGMLRRGFCHVDLGPTRIWDY